MLPRSGERLLPLLSAVLLLLSFPPLHLLVPPFVALVPFALFVEDVGEGRAGAQAALRGGLLLGLVFFGGLLHWIPVALWNATVWALPLYAAVVGVLSSLTGAAGWALQRIRRRAGAPLWIALPLVWTAGEWLRAHLPGGLAFPWLGLGASLTGFPELLGVAELVGPRGVTFWIALVAGLVATVVVRWREGRIRWGLIGALAAAVVVPAGWGLWRAETLAVRPAARVAVVQPGVSPDARQDPEVALEATRSALVSLAPGGGSDGIELVVWPETVLPVRFDGPTGREARSAARRVSRTAGAPVLVGAYGTSNPGDGGRAGGRHNSAFLVDSTGATSFVYHKRHLVPVVERAPRLPAWARAGEGEWGELRPGDEAPVGALARGTRFGVLICYESAFSGAARSYRRRGADLLVNMTNDAWFGGRSAPTGGVWQHPAHLVLRAVETRAGVARAANGGISLFVDPVGRIHGAAPLHERSVRVRTVQTTDVRTLYVRLGDLVGPAAVCLTLLLLAVGRRRA